MKTITVVTPCFNEEANIRKCYSEVKSIFNSIDKYNYEHLFIDNASTDNTYSILEDISKNNHNVKVIRNSRNFGWIRSPYYGLLQAEGDAAVLLSADLQEPPALIPRFIQEWEDGGKSIIGVKKSSEESALMYKARELYYNISTSLSEINLIRNFHGFGLYDRDVLDILKDIKDPYPYFRGLIPYIGLEIRTVEYDQKVRSGGVTSGNFYSLYDAGILGLISHSKVPLRLATMLGFSCSILSLIVAFFYLLQKLVFWDTFTIGTAPLIIGLFFFCSIILLFIGILGEYVGFLHEKNRNYPIVIEKNRINF